MLIEDPQKSYHAKRRVSDNYIFDNRLIFGDNLLALKALEQEFAGKIKCIYHYTAKKAQESRSGLSMAGWARAGARRTLLERPSAWTHRPY